MAEPGGLPSLELQSQTQLKRLSSSSRSSNMLGGGSDGKESACNVGDLGSIFGLGKSSGEWNSYPLQYSGLENFMDRGA